MREIYFEPVGKPIKLTAPVPRHVVITSDLVYSAWNITMPHQPREYAVGVVGRHAGKNAYKTTHILEMVILRDQNRQILQSADGIEIDYSLYVRKMVESGADAAGYRIVGIFHSHPPRNQIESQKDIRTLKRWENSFIGAVLSPERTVKFFGQMPYSSEQKDRYRLRKLEDDFYELSDNPQIFFERSVPVINRLRELTKRDNSGDANPSFLKPISFHRLGP